MKKITIDIDKKCNKCDEGGALPNGYCLPCFYKYKLPELLKEYRKLTNDRRKP